MNRYPGERIFSFLCDFWWAILLAILLGLAAFFTRGTWLSWLGISPAATPVAISTPSVSRLEATREPTSSIPTNTQRPNANEWLTYSNPLWGVSLSYPSQIGNKQIYLIEENSRVPMGPDKILLLSDSPQANSQQLLPDETTRVLIFRMLPDDTTFDEWAALMSGYVGTGSLIPSSLGSCKNSLFIRADAPVLPYQWSEATWVEDQGYYYGVLLQGLGDMPFEIDTIMESFITEGCR